MIPAAVFGICNYVLRFERSIIDIKKKPRTLPRFLSSLDADYIAKPCLLAEPTLAPTTPLRGSHHRQHPLMLQRHQQQSLASIT